VLLPVLETGEDETFLIVAGTDLSSAEVLTRRIVEQLERSPELKMAAAFKVSAAAIQLPSREAGNSVDKLLQEVANKVTAMAMGALRPRQDWGETPNGNHSG
jgi:hypothetical protein